MKHKIRLCILFVLLLAVMTAIFVFSSQNADKSQKLSDGFLDRLGKFLNFLPLFKEDAGNKIRKAAHFSEFMCLGLLSALFFREWFLRKKSRLERTALISCIFCFLYACSDEIHQIFVPGRACRLKDVLIDCGGAITGIAFALLIAYLLDRKAGQADNEDTFA